MSFEHISLKHTLIKNIIILVSGGQKYQYYGKSRKNISIKMTSIN